MTTLTAKKISDTYKDLLQVSNSNAGVDATLRLVSDGEGTDSCLQLSTTALGILSADTSSKMKLYHDNTDAFIDWNAGEFILITNEGVNEDGIVGCKGKGTGIGKLKLYDQDDAEWLTMYASAGVGFIHTAGSAPGALKLQDGAVSNVTCFGSAESGETKEFRVFGFRAADSLLSLQIGVGVDAANTASFDGVANYYFDGRGAFGLVAPLAQVHIDQAVDDAAIPVLSLDQADISDGFVNFIGATAASAAGPISSWTNAAVAGYVRCEINGAQQWLAYYADPTS